MCCCQHILIGNIWFTKKLKVFVLTRGTSYRTVSPYASEWFRIHATNLGATSNWSERHVAYAAGLGTFSINDGFITEKGIAIRLISVVTELKLTPDIRKAKSHTQNCLLCSIGICGACIKRCPVNSISKAGHDKVKCYIYVYGDESKKLAQSYGGNPEVGQGVVYVRLEYLANAKILLDSLSRNLLEVNRMSKIYSRALLSSIYTLNFKFEF